MMTRLLAILIAIALPADNAKAQSHDPTPSSEAAAMTPLETRANEVVAVLNGDDDGEAIFAPVFLNAVPLDQLAALSRQLTDQFGPALGVEDVTPSGETVALVTVRMERAIGQLNLSIDPSDDNRINGLRLLEFKPTGDTIDKVTADLKALDGKVSAYFGPLYDGKATLSLNPKAQMPLGSAMKLYVLGALGQEIAQGTRSWNDVVTLDTKSFPSGQMQNWPKGSPVTLHTLASLMISISDNTATDQLVNLLGRETIEAYMAQTGHSAPALNTPWITTRELFLIKGGSSETLEAYSNGPVAERAAILETLEENPATLEQINAKLAAGPVAIESVEWFANAADLAGLFRMMRRNSDPEALRIMAINPALPPSVTDQWGYVGFKGGSETGVLNMTWLLVDLQGKDWVLTLSWANSDKPVETQTLLLIAQRILSLKR
ncbi:MAG: serine hydrolase [Pseudomonadota bacterium]